MGPTPSSPEHIHEGPDITVVDLEDCDAPQVAKVYRVLADRIAQGELRCLLVKSGRRAPKGHEALSDALRNLLRHSSVPAGLRLALLPQTPGASATFRELARQFKRSGIPLRIFDDEAEALAWLALEA